VLAAEKGRSGEVYNIGSGSDGEIPNKAVAAQILELLDKPASLIQFVADRPAHDRRYAVDFSKAKSELGWQPSTDFHKGLEKTVSWYISNPQWWRSIKTGDYLKFYERNYGSRGNA